MSEERRQILNMLADKKITVDEAERLLEAIGEKAVSEETPHPTTAKKKPKYFCIKVNPKRKVEGKHDQVNIKIPLMLVKTGVKLGSIMPDHAKKKIQDKLDAKGIGIDVNNLDEESLDELINSLTDLSIDVDDEDEEVKIFCE
jgi:hypothetical protein